MNTQDQLPLAPRDLLILAVLAEGPLHGYGIIKAVEDRSEAGVLLDPANLYRVLRRMSSSAWIQEAPAASVEAADQGDSRRRTYEIAPGGRSLLAAEMARLERLLRQVRPALARGTGS